MTRRGFMGSAAAFPVAAGYLPKYDLGDVRVTVVPHNSLGMAGRPIVSGWVRVPKSN